jgi:glycosyltransferase involved in cell wall biosynthesis
MSSSRPRSGSLQGDDGARFLKQQSVGSFWLPLYLSLWASAPTQTWCDSHVAAVVTLSFAAHVLYAWAGQAQAALARRAAADRAAEAAAAAAAAAAKAAKAAPAPGAAAAAAAAAEAAAAAAAAAARPPARRPRTRLALTAAPDWLRAAAGLLRWLLMPLVVLHALFAPLRGAHAAGAAAAAALAAAAVSTARPGDGAAAAAAAALAASGAGGAPLVDMAALLRRLAGARLLAAIDALRATGVDDASGAAVIPVHLLPLTAPAPFLLAAGAFLAFRALQVTLWLFAAPPLPVRVAPGGLTGEAAAAAALAAPHLFPGGEFNAARYGQLRVLIIGDSVPPKVDGVAIRVGHLVRQLQAAGHVAHIVTSIRSRDDPLHGAQITQLPGYVSRWYLEHSFSIPTPALLLAFLRFRPHVLHVMDEGFISAAAICCGSLCLTPMVFSHHSHIDRFAAAYVPWLGTFNLATHLTQLLRRIFAAQSDVHLAVGHEMQASLEHAGCGPLIGQWACGVDVDAFSPLRRSADTAEGSLRWRLTGGRPHLPIVVYCGRVAPEKRLELISVMARHLVCLIRQRKRDQRAAELAAARASGGGSGSGAAAAPPTPSRAAEAAGPAATVIDESAAAVLLEASFGRDREGGPAAPGSATTATAAADALHASASRSSLASLGEAAGGEGGEGAEDVPEWEREPVVAIVIVGKGPMIEPLKGWLSDLGPSHNVNLGAAYPGAVALEANAEICQGSGGRGTDAAGTAAPFPGLADLHAAAARGGEEDDEAAGAEADEGEGEGEGRGENADAGAGAGAGEGAGAEPGAGTRARARPGARSGADAAGEPEAAVASPSSSQQLRQRRRRGTSVSSAASSTRSASAANGVVSVFCGQISHGATLGSVYATADAFFSPSDVETLGQVFQEAMSAGTVPVGAAASGVLEVLTHGREGYHFDPHDMREAAAFVLRAIDDRATAPPGHAYAGTAAEGAPPVAAAAHPARAKHISENARERVLSKSWGLAFEQAMVAYTRSCLTRWHVGRTRD